MGIWNMNCWEFKPITYRHDQRKWPDGNEVFKGKDDEDYLHKTAVMTRYTSLASAFLITTDIVTLPPRKNGPPAGIPHTLSRVRFWAIPIIGGGITYTTVVNMLANLRKKTDHTNHFLAGLSVGAVVGKHCKHFVTGSLTGLFFGVLGVLIKNSELYNWPFFFQYPTWKKHGTWMSNERDFTITPERRGYWVRDESEIPALQARGQI